MIERVYIEELKIDNYIVWLRVSLWNAAVCREAFGLVKVYKSDKIKGQNDRQNNTKYAFNAMSTAIRLLSSAPLYKPLDVL